MDGVKAASGLCPSRPTARGSQGGGGRDSFPGPRSRLRRAAGDRARLASGGAVPLWLMFVPLGCRAVIGARPTVRVSTSPRGPGERRARIQ